MLKNYDKESQQDVTRLFVNGYIQFNSSVMSEKNLYDKYKTQEAIISNPSVKLGMEVLELLESLGFSMDEVGTYFYKDLIVKIILMLTDDLATRAEIEEALESAYSQLYFDVARNDLDIGIKTFREFVNLALEKVDITKANQELLDSVIAKMEDAVSNNQLPLVIAEHSKALNLGANRVRLTVAKGDNESEAD